MENACLSQNWKFRTVFNTLAADDKYSRRNMQNFQQQLQTALSQKQKIFFCNFYCFYQTYIKFRTFWSKNVSLIVSVFPKLLNTKEVVTWTSKTPCFRTPFGNQRVREFQTLSKSGLVNTLIAERCSEARRLDVQVTTSFGVNNLGNTETIKTHIFWSKCSKFNVGLIKAIKIAEKFFWLPFIKPTLNLEHFDKKMWVL